MPKQTASGPNLSLASLVSDTANAMAELARAGATIEEQVRALVERSIAISTPVAAPARVRLAVPRNARRPSMPTSARRGR